MNIRIGNDIRMTLTVRGPKNYTRFNVKQIKCFLINECLTGCPCCSDCGCKCPIERRFPREPFPQYYTPTPYTLHNCGKPMYFADPWNCKHAYSNFGGHFHDPHWWPEYRGFGITPRKFVDCCYHHHMHHSMDIFHYDPKPIDPWHCDKCAYKAGHYGHTPCGEFVYMMDATMLDGENRIQCMFPAKDQIMCGAYKLVLVITTFEQGWGCRNLHTETIDYGTVFTIVDTEDGQTGDIDINLDNYDPKDNSNVSSITVNSTSIPAYIFRGDSEIHIGDTDTVGNIYGFNVTTKSGDTKPWDPETWVGDKFEFSSSNTDVIEIAENGTMTIHDVQTRTVVTITITDKLNQSVVYQFDIAVDPSSSIQPSPTVSSVSISWLHALNPGASGVQEGDTISVLMTVRGTDLTRSSLVLLYKDGVKFDKLIETTGTPTSTLINYAVDDTDLTPGIHTYEVYSVDDPSKTASTTCEVVGLPKINNVHFRWRMDDQATYSKFIYTNPEIRLNASDYGKTILVAYTGASISNYDPDRHVIVVRGITTNPPSEDGTSLIDVSPNIDEIDYDQNLVTRWTYDSSSNVRNTTFTYDVYLYERQEGGVYSNANVLDHKTYTVQSNIANPLPSVTEVNTDILVWGQHGLMRTVTLNSQTSGTTININESSLGTSDGIIRVYYRPVEGSNLNQQASTEYIKITESTGDTKYGIANGSASRDGAMILEYRRSPSKGEDIFIQQKCGIDVDWRNDITIHFVDDVSPVIQDAYVDVMMQRGQSITLVTVPIEYADDKSDTDTTILRNTINIGRLENQLSIDFYHRGVFGQNITSDTQRGIKVLCKLYNNNNEVIGGVTSVGYIEDQRIVSCPISNTDAVRLEATITYLSDPDNIKYTYVFPLTYNYSLDDVAVSYRVYINDEQTQTATNLADGVLSNADNGSTIWLGVPNVSLLPKTLIFEFDYNEVEGTGLSDNDKIITVRHIVKNMQGDIISSETGSAGVEGSRLLSYSMQPGQYLMSQFDIKCGADSDYRTTVFFDRDEDPSLGD